jgi:putative cardiolipin synthase
MRVIRFLLVIVVLLVVFVIGMGYLFPLPDKSGVETSEGVPASENTTLGALSLSESEKNPGLSGVYPLADGPEALAARVLLARNAEETIDAQYYIWQMDTTSFLLLDELRQAAERGVRVRLLLDDNGIPGLDDMLSGLNAMENFEVRLYNPFTLRSPKLLSYTFNFSRLNHRMHNKSMTADGAVSVIGGRNIGDIYFEFGEGAHYFDFDVIAMGPVAQATQETFDAYWSSAAAYPAELLLEDAPDGAQQVADAGAAARESVDGSAYVEKIRNSNLMADLTSQEGFFDWTEVQLLTDDPAKTQKEVAREDLLVRKLGQILATAEEKVDLISAYFIPADEGTALLTSLAEKGVDTRVMTNSLESNDVAPVHSAYMKYRPQLLEDGVKMLELRSDSPNENTALVPDPLGVSSSLHAKSFAIDGRRVFIGSFNFDPRSASLNTEMGYLIDSPEIAANMAAALDDVEDYYRVTFDDDGRIVWFLTRDATDEQFEVEPNTSAFQRAVVTFMSWLPVEWML